MLPTPSVAYEPHWSNDQSWNQAAMRTGDDHDNWALVAFQERGSFNVENFIMQRRVTYRHWYGDQYSSW